MRKWRECVNDSNSPIFKGEQPSGIIVEDLGYTSDKFVTGLEQLPRSLKGTEVDGEIIINESSELVPTRGLRRLYDYFLSALGEESNATIDARVEAYILNTTPQPAAAEAIKIYHQYQNYLKQMSSLQQQKMRLKNEVFDPSTVTNNNELIDIAAIKKQQKHIKSIRKQWFSSAVESAFFDIDDQLLAYNTQMLKIAQDKTLTQEQKQKAKQQYLKSLPDNLTKQQAEQQKNLDQLLRRTQNMKQRGAIPEQLFEMRTELVGVQAAERLQALDEKNQDFDRRFERYQQQKQKILNSTQSEVVKNQELQELEQKLFSKKEQKRLIGYEQFKQQNFT